MTDALRQLQVQEISGQLDSLFQYADRVVVLASLASFISDMSDGQRQLEENLRLIGIAARATLRREIGDEDLGANVVPFTPV